jgi:hypothetical protein
MTATAALQLHRLLLRIAFAAANIFAWLFIFQYLYVQNLSAESALAQTLLLYALSQGFTCLLTPYAAIRLRSGAKSSITLALVFAGASLIVLGGAFDGYFATNFSFALCAFAIFLGTYRALYFVPYSVERANEPHIPGRSLIIEMFIALIPALAGSAIALELLSPVYLLYILAFFALLAIVPLYAVREVQEGFSFGYLETFEALLSRENRRYFWTSIFQGIEGAILILLWPIVVFTLLGFSYKTTGLVMSMTFLFAILFRDSAFNLFRKYRIHDSPAVAAAIASSAWIGRLLVLSPASIIFVDTYHFLGIPNQAEAPIHFDQAADSAFYIDELTALREMGLSLGRIVICLVAAGIALGFSMLYVFLTCVIIAAIVAATSTVLNRTKQGVF